MNFWSIAMTTAVILLLGHFELTFADDALDQRLQAVSVYLQNEQNSDITLTGKHEINFREQRFSELLAEPAIFSGKLIYESETRTMSKVVDKPDAISMTMTEKAVVIESAAGKRRLSLRARPALRAILIGFRALVEGDVESLRSHFDLEYKNTIPEWELVLTPRSKRLAKRLTSLVITGQSTQVDSIVTNMKNGDRQLMTLIPIATVNE